MKELEKHLEESSVENLVVLCRGKSIDKLCLLKEEFFEKKYSVVFVNKFSELKNNHSVLNLIGHKNKNNFNIQYINNDQCNIENENDLKNFRIKYIQANKKTDDHDASIQLKYARNISSYPTIFDIHSKTSDDEYKLKSNGMSCLGYFSTFTSIKNFYIFGLDFFEVDYFSHHVHTGKKEVREYQPAKGKIAKCQLLDLVDLKKEINYHLYTYAEFDDNQKNNFFIY